MNFLCTNLGIVTLIDDLAMESLDVMMLALGKPERNYDVDTVWSLFNTLPDYCLPPSSYRQQYILCHDDLVGLVPWFQTMSMFGESRLPDFPCHHIPVYIRTHTSKVAVSTRQLCDATTAGVITTGATTTGATTTGATTTGSALWYRFFRITYINDLAFVCNWIR